MKTEELKSQGLTDDQIAFVMAENGKGSGLFRSEFLYLAASDYPTGEEQ